MRCCSPHELAATCLVKYLQLSLQRLISVSAQEVGLDNCRLLNQFLGQHMTQNQSKVKFCIGLGSLPLETRPINIPCRLRSYTHMQSTITPAEGSIVKIIIDIDEAELEPGINAALSKLSKEVRIPGFRQGKVPRKVLEAKLGRSYIRSEAINDAVQGFLGDAIKQNSLDVIATQSVNIKSGEESGPVVLEADVEIRPEVNIAGYKGLKVEVPSPVVSAQDIDNQIKRLREQFGELKEVDRPIKEDDQVSIDLDAERDGEKIPGLSVEDFLYRVGGDNFVPGLDEALLGHSSNEEVAFEVAAPDASGVSPINCTVKIKKVSELELPDLTDEWAAEASEFQTLAELEESIREQLASGKLSRAKMMLRDRVVGALVELMDLKEIPQALIQNEFDKLVHDFSHRLEEQGIPLEQYLSVTGTTSEQLVSQIMADAANQAKIDLVLRALVREEATVVPEEELDEEIKAYADSAGIDFQLFKEQVTTNGQIKVVELEMAKSKALENLLKQVEIVDEDGNSIDREILLADDEPSNPDDIDGPTDENDQSASGGAANDDSI